MIVYILKLLDQTLLKSCLYLPQCGWLCESCWRAAGRDMGDGKGRLTRIRHDAVIGVGAASWVGAGTRGGAGRGAPAGAPPPLRAPPGKGKGAPFEAGGGWLWGAPPPPPPPGA